MSKSHAARLEKLDRQACIKDKNSEPVFVSWRGHPWTEEEKKKAIREHPDQRMFWKRLTDTVPHEDLVRQKKLDHSLNHGEEIEPLINTNKRKF